MTTNLFSSKRVVPPYDINSSLCFLCDITNGLSGTADYSTNILMWNQQSRKLKRKITFSISDVMKKPYVKPCPPKTRIFPSPKSQKLVEVLK